MNSLIADNLTCLEQGIRLLQQFDNERYQSPGADGSSSLGEHIRHNLDHYLCFLRQLPEGRVDYDRRERDSAIARSPSEAQTICREIMDGLKALGPEELNRPLQVSVETGPDSEPLWSQSSVQRELQFLVSHTVHHYALILPRCRAAGIMPEETFGIAPSTLKHRDTANRV